MYSILVATNFSRTSDNAVLYSASLAQLLNTKLVLFNAFKLPIHASNARISATSMDTLIEKTKEKLRKQSLKLSKDFKIKVEYQCSYFDLEREIDSLMKLHNSKLLVMGMSAKSMEQNLLGNPTTTLISMKRFPVWAIPVNAKYSGIHKILFACDIMQDIPLRTLAKLRRAAIQLKSEVTVFYVEKKINELKSDNKAFENIEKGLENVTYFYKKVNSDAVIKAIEKEIEKSSFDLLVMMPKKYGFWESIVHRSKTRVMASGINIPLLSIPID
ncbi:universal stress protein [Muricauda sp. 334s03]|uniref:Universal stress protein n=1 Tax=Flagellimonas yonaguniensis TaxID=3031325 RepID=A0ABT5Y5L2_9FLAO|nr:MULTISPECIES: universal stress protein [Allomuricauda]MDF0718287.1 universal stress protein [[Muricauda] yonaguniensis]|tara:strand:- start:720 stop:1535 length:816 start_codon:yes stop_codon:yes gene_type:complete